MDACNRAPLIITKDARPKMVDAHFQDGVGSISLSLFATKVANKLYITVCNLSPPRLPKLRNQQLLMLCWHSFSRCCRACVLVRFDHWGGQCVNKIPWHTNVNILPVAFTYPNATINVKPEMQNPRLDPLGLAKPGDTHWLTGRGPGLPHQESEVRVFRLVWNWTDPFLRLKPEPQAAYLEQLLTLCMCDIITRKIHIVSWLSITLWCCSYVSSNWDNIISMTSLYYDQISCVCRAFTVNSGGREFVIQMSDTGIVKAW